MMPSDVAKAARPRLSSFLVLRPLRRISRDFEQELAVHGDRGLVGDRGAGQAQSQSAERALDVLAVLGHLQEVLVGLRAADDVRLAFADVGNDQVAQADDREVDRARILELVDTAQQRLGDGDPVLTADEATQLAEADGAGALDVLVLVAAVGHGALQDHEVLARADATQRQGCVALMQRLDVVLADAALRQALAQDVALSLGDGRRLLQPDGHEQRDQQVGVRVVPLHQREQALRGGGVAGVRAGAAGLVAQESDRHRGERTRACLVVVASVLEDAEEELAHLVELAGVELVRDIRTTQHAEADRGRLQHDELVLHLRVEALLEELDLLRVLGHLADGDVRGGRDVLVAAVLRIHGPLERGQDVALDLRTDVMRGVRAVRTVLAADLEERVFRRHAGVERLLQVLDVGLVVVVPEHPVLEAERAGGTRVLGSPPGVVGWGVVGWPGVVGVGAVGRLSGVVGAGVIGGPEGGGGWGGVGSLGSRWFGGTAPPGPRY